MEKDVDEILVSPGDVVPVDLIVINHVSEPIRCSDSGQIHPHHP